MTLSICFSPPKKRNLFIHLSISHGLNNIYLKQTKITTLQQSWFFSRVKTLEKGIKSPPKIITNPWWPLKQILSQLKFLRPSWPLKLKFQEPTWPSKQMFYRLPTFERLWKTEKDKRTLTFFWGSPNPQNKVFIF